FARVCFTTKPAPELLVREESTQNSPSNKVRSSVGEISFNASSRQSVRAFSVASPYSLALSLKAAKSSAFAVPFRSGERYHAPYTARASPSLTGNSFRLTKDMRASSFESTSADVTNVVKV